MCKCDQCGAATKTAINETKVHVLLTKCMAVNQGTGLRPDTTSARIRDIGHNVTICVNVMLKDTFTICYMAKTTNAP